MTISEFLETDPEPIPDSNYGDGYRCSARLKDGTFLPCVVVRKSGQYVDLALRRFEEEKSGESINGKSKDGYRRIVESFVSGGNRINEYDVASVEASRYALPLSLMRQIVSETFMSWTGFVLKMKDGNAFSFGTTFLFEFFDLPEGYSFEDVREVHNHSYVDEQNTILPLTGAEIGPNGKYDRSKVYRERPYFDCFMSRGI